MPCRCDGYEDDTERRMLKDLDQVTRAACDMRTILREHQLEHHLCLETIEWIKRHDKADAERIEIERANNMRDKMKRDALDKLNVDERRILGL